MHKNSRIRKKSDKKILRDKIGAVHNEILKIKRGDRCELCGRQANNVGRFHILRVGIFPRLEFVELNILRSCWMPCHYTWHHNGPMDSRNQKILQRILKLRKHDTWEKLLLELKILHATMPRHDPTYLKLLYHALQIELERLKQNGRL